MFKQNLDVNSYYTAIKNFKQLGTGRNFKRVLIGDSDDARNANFIYSGHVYHNWPSWRQVTIIGERKLITYDTSTKTVLGKPACIFFWNDLTADLWFRQIERQKLLKWLETASPADFIAMSQLILEEASAEHQISENPQLVCLHYHQIQIEIQKLGLPALRRLNSLIEGDLKLQKAKAA